MACRDELLQDWSRVSEAPYGLKRFIGKLILDARFCTVFLFRLSTLLYRRGWRVSSRLVYRLNLMMSACDLSPKAHVGPGLLLAHPLCIVIGHDVELGRDATLFQGVTLGARSVSGQNGGLLSEYPVVGDQVVLYPHVLVYGKIHIGDGAVVLGNSVASRDVPAGSTCGGTPAVPLAP